MHIGPNLEKNKLCIEKKEINVYIILFCFTNAMNVIKTELYKYTGFKKKAPSKCLWTNNQNI